MDHAAPSAEQTLRAVFFIIVIGAAAFVGASLIMTR